MINDPSPGYEALEFAIGWTLAVPQPGLWNPDLEEFVESLYGTRTDAFVRVDEAMNSLPSGMAGKFSWGRAGYTRAAEAYRDIANENEKSSLKAKFLAGLTALVGEMPEMKWMLRGDKRNPEAQKPRIRRVAAAVIPGAVARFDDRQPPRFIRCDFVVGSVSVGAPLYCEVGEVSGWSDADLAQQIRGRAPHFGHNPEG